MRFFSKSFRQIIAIGCLILLPTETISAQNKSDEDLGLFAEKSIQWREVGPMRGGRSCAVAGIVNDPLTYYAGYTGGGVWKTTDAGTSWNNISDGYFGGSIGAVSVAESDANIIYVGEGEKTVRGDFSSGWGMWKSTDAGKTWNHIGLKESRSISRIRIHPTNPDIVYVAVIGDLWKSSNERGVYKTIDGGKTWNKILFANADAGAIDLTFDPSDTNTLYATTYRVRRNGYRLDSGGIGSDLWKTTDAGKTWKKLTNNPGLPKTTVGNIGITVSPVNPNRLYAMIEAKKGGMYRSDDAGKTWVYTSGYVELYQKAYYYMRLYADPKDENKVTVLNTRYHISNDGGKTFTSHKASHVDNHDMWIDPINPKRIALAHDGGVQITFNDRETWSTVFNQTTAQFYRVSTDNAFPFNMYSGQQDWGTLRIANTTTPGNYNEDSNNSPWTSTAGSESGYVAADPLNNKIVYGGTFKGYMMRKDHTTGQLRSVNIWPVNPAGHGVEVMKYRFNWNFPIFFSPHNPKKLYAASNHLHVTYDEGNSWEVISPDLTKADPETMRSSGGEISDDNTGVEFYATIFTAKEAANEKGVIWTGSDDGLVHVTKNNGENWKNSTPTDFPQNAMVNDISIDPKIKGQAYIAVTSYKFGDYTPYLYKVSNYGATWEKITNGIPNQYYTRTIEADTKRPGLLFAGTEWGMYISFDYGKHWSPFQNNLPITSIRDLEVKNNKLIAATHGRGFWIIDDVSVIRQISDSVLVKKQHLFKPPVTYRGMGTEIKFYLKSLTKNKTIEIRIINEKNQVIRTFSTSPKKGKKKLKVSNGVNTIQWEQRYEGFKEFEGLHFYSSPNRGPYAFPGNYKVELKVGNEIVSQNFELKKDPRLTVTQEELKQQFNYLIKVRDAVSLANNTLTEIRNLRKTSKPNSKKAKKLRKLENLLQDERIVGGRDPLKYGVRLNNRLAFLLTDQQRGDYPPTVQAEEVFELLYVQLQDVIQQIKNIKKY